MRMPWSNFSNEPALEADPSTPGAEMGHSRLYWISLGLDYLQVVHDQTPKPWSATRGLGQLERVTGIEPA